MGVWTHCWIWSVWRSTVSLSVSSSIFAHTYTHTRTHLCVCGRWFVLLAGKPLSLSLSLSVCAYLLPLNLRQEPLLRLRGLIGHTTALRFAHLHTHKQTQTETERERAEGFVCCRVCL